MRQNTGIFDLTHGGQFLSRYFTPAYSVIFMRLPCASSAAIDLHAKKQAYRRNGVNEYIVWQVLDQKISGFYLEGEYLERSPDPNGVLRSQVFPGLWLDVEKLLVGDMRRVLATLQAGTHSPEHSAFVQKLIAG